MSTPRLNLVVIRVADLERAAAFYRAIGLTFERHAHGSGLEHLAAETAGGVFELYPATPSQPVDASTRIGFAVTDVDATLASLGGVGTPPGGAKASPWGRRAVVTDPDGHRVELVGDVLS